MGSDTNLIDNRFNDRFGAASSAEARATTKRIAEKYLARSCRFAAACDAREAGWGLCGAAGGG
jgi:hypothetical protein